MALNKQQEEAVLTTEGPLLILAGAGAGKTKTLTERMVHLIKNGASPSSLLAVTFTNKAAKEMRERVVSRLVEEGILEEYSPYQSTPVIKTFHSLGVMILSENAERLGLPRHPTILDTGDTGSLIRDIVVSLSLDPKTHDPTKLRHIISREKSDGNTPEAYEKKVMNFSMEVVHKVWKMYEESLRKQKALDFDDLIVRTVHLLENHRDIRERYHARFSHVHIDEYQDTNESQYTLTRLLTNPHTRNICVVGDADQNIYSWRGANMRNILNFEKDFPGTKVVLLEENYRSTKAILDLANRAIQKNTVRKEKNLFTRQASGEKVTLLSSWDEVSEAAQVAQECKELIASGVSPSSIAVLYRANFQSRILEEEFLHASIPYNLLGTRFFERREVKDALSYLRAALNRDSLPDLKRVFETPKKGLGKVTLAKVFAGEELPASARLKVAHVYKFLDLIKERVLTEPLSHVMQMIIVDSGLEKELLDGSSEDKERLENVRELVTITTKYDSVIGEESVASFLEEVSLLSDQDNDDKAKNGVRLMTLHASKGLEYDVVFLTGLEQDLFPHKNISGKKRTTEEEEEERRLFYVGVTRGRKKLYLSYAELRTIFGQKHIATKSEFLDDLVPEDTEVRDTFFKERENTILYF